MQRGQVLGWWSIPAPGGVGSWDKEGRREWLPIEVSPTGSTMALGSLGHVPYRSSALHAI